VHFRFVIVDFDQFVFLRHVLERIQFKEIVARLLLENLNVLCFRLIELWERGSLVRSILTNSSPSCKDNV
jgi:hypothetical protein